MRYIREFSELSGRIRYAGQGKRIIIEMALIKLCRPQMEVSQDSLLESIRAVEQQLEKGVVMQASPGAAPQAAAAPPGQEKASHAFLAADLPKAIPEDVSRIVANWPTLVGQTAMPMKQYLKKAKLSLGGDNRLMVVLEDGLASDYFLKQEETRKNWKSFFPNFPGSRWR